MSTKIANQPYFFNVLVVSLCIKAVRTEWVPHCHPIADQETTAKTYVLCIGFILVSLTMMNIFLSMHCCCKLILNSCTTASQYNIPTDMLVLFVAICFFCCLSGILWTFHIIISYFCLSSFTTWMAVGIGGDDCYRIGLSMLFLLYSLRLKRCFQKTELSLSILTLTFCIVCFLIQLIIPIFTTYYFMLNDWISGLRCVYTWISVNTICCFYLLILFVKKIIHLASKCSLTSSINRVHIINPSSINKTVSSNSTSIGTSNTSSNTEKDISYDNKNEIDILSPTLKYIICAFISIISTDLMSIFIITRSEGYDSEIMWIASLCSGVLDETINLYCLYLQFPFANAVYWKCCKKLHVFCIKKMFKRYFQTDLSDHVTEKYSVQLSTKSRPSLNKSITTIDTTKSHVVDFTKQIKEKIRD